MPPWKEFIETTLTMLPRPPSRSRGRANAWARKNGVVRFRPMTSCQSSADVSAAGARRIMPALLTSTLRSSNAAPAPGDQVRGGLRRQRAEVELPGRAADPAIGDGVADRVERLDVDGDDVRPGLGERERHRLAEAARGPGDDRAPAAQREEPQDPIAHRISESRYSGATPTDS